MESVELELLAPARDLEVGRTAIACGADAVYIGPRAFGARAAAGNSTADIAALVEYAHRFGARVFATMNTIVFDHELDEARALALELYNVGVDALIVQDMAYTQMGLPIALHASTQCDIRTPSKAAMLAQAGFRRLVLPREFTPAHIAEVAQAAGVPIEVFIHGARCVSYSGDCQMGYAATGRSANRGACPQMCRLPYDLVDATGKPVAPRGHYLSLSDMRTPDLSVLTEAGASSFKIEGRLKDRRYVANAVAWYSQRLDELVEASEGRYHRASAGRSVPGFVPDLGKGFFRRPNGPGKEACIASPNDTGVAVGRVQGAFSPRSRSFTVKAKAALANGDGLGYFDSEGNFCGFRLNRVAGEQCFPATALPDLKAGLTLYRNSDKAFNDAVDSARPERRLRVDFELSLTGNTLTLSAQDEFGRMVANSMEYTATPARSPQEQQRRGLLERLGDTCYYAGAIADSLGDLFVPASVLTSMRRKAVEALEQLPPVATAETPGADTLAPDALAGSMLTYHDNVANELARRFYRSHGAAISEQAVECAKPEQSAGKQVMHTRYCIRRELGACLRTPQGSRLPEPLYLRNDSGTYRLAFDCRNCEMRVVKEG